MTKGHPNGIEKIESNEMKNLSMHKRKQPTRRVNNGAKRCQRQLMPSSRRIYGIEKIFFNL